MKFGWFTALLLLPLSVGCPTPQPDVPPCKNCEIDKSTKRISGQWVNLGQEASPQISWPIEVITIHVVEGSQQGEEFVLQMNFEVNASMDEELGDFDPNNADPADWDAVEIYADDHAQNRFEDEVELIE